MKWIHVNINLWQHHSSVKSSPNVTDFRPRPASGLLSCYIPHRKCGSLAPSLTQVSPGYIELLIHVPLATLLSINKKYKTSIVGPIFQV